MPLQLLARLAWFALLVVHTVSVNPMRGGRFFFFRGGESAADVVDEAARQRPLGTGDATNINNNEYEEYSGDDDNNSGWSAFDEAPSRWRGCDEGYVVGAEIGSGKYSHVFAGTRRRDNASVAIKVLKPPTPLWKVRREVRVLRELRGGPHVVKLVDAVRVRMRPEARSPAARPAKPADEATGEHAYGLVFERVGRAEVASGGGSRWLPCRLTHSDVGRMLAGLKGKLDAALDPPPAEEAATTVARGAKRATMVGVGRGGDDARAAQGVQKMGRSAGSGAWSRGGRGLSDLEVRWVMYELLEALAFAHSRGVMHRDIKPSNVLVSARQQRRQRHHHRRRQRHHDDPAAAAAAAGGSAARSSQSCRSRALGLGWRSPPLHVTVVDWGLAEFIKKPTSRRARGEGGGAEDGTQQPDQEQRRRQRDVRKEQSRLPEYSVRVASRYYKAPELLLGNSRYDESLDLWSAGCVLAGLLFEKEPFFKGCDHLEQLSKIAEVVGSERLLDYADSFCSPTCPAVAPASPEVAASAAVAAAARAEARREAAAAAEAEEAEATRGRQRRKVRSSSRSSTSTGSSSGLEARLLHKGLGLSKPVKAAVGACPPLSLRELSGIDEGLFSGSSRRRSHGSRRNRRNDLLGDDALDLLQQLLCVDHRDRPSAAAALQHAYFAPVRRRKNKPSDGEAAGSDSVIRKIRDS